MPFAIGLRFYRISIRRKGEKENLEIGPGRDPCDLIGYVKDFVQRRTEPTVHAEEQRTWFFEELATSSIRVVHGYINYGTHGFESKLKDVKTRRQKYVRQASDLEEIPLYFQFWMPTGSTFALAAFQSFQGPYKDLRSRFGDGTGNVVEFDGHKFESVKADVEFGGRRRTVGVFGYGQDVGLIDVSDDVKREANGHPNLASIERQVDSLMETYYAGMKT